jgi:hypothetical protein
MVLYLTVIVYLPCLRFSSFCQINLYCFISFQPKFMPALFRHNTASALPFDGKDDFQGTQAKWPKFRG